MTATNLKDIEITFEGWGEYGIHGGFFNAIAVIDGKSYDFQCCVEDDNSINFDDCGYDWGLCHDANEELAEKIGEENVLDLLMLAYAKYKAS